MRGVSEAAELESSMAVGLEVIVGLGEEEFSGKSELEGELGLEVVDLVDVRIVVGAGTEDGAVVAGF